MGKGELMVKHMAKALRFYHRHIEFCGNIILDKDWCKGDMQRSQAKFNTFWKAQNMNLGWIGFVIIETVQQDESELKCPGTDFSCDRLFLKRQKMDWMF